MAALSSCTAGGEVRRIHQLKIRRRDYTCQQRMLPVGFARKDCQQQW